MNKIFVLRITDADGSLPEVIVIDLKKPLLEQLQSVAARQATHGHARMKLYVGEGKDYHPQTVFDIMNAIGGAIEWNVVPDTSETTDINADLILNDHV